MQWYILAIVFTMILLFALAHNVLRVQAAPHPREAKSANDNAEPCQSTAPTPIQPNDLRTGRITGQQHIRADVDIVSTPKQNAFSDPAFWVQFILAGVGSAGIVVGLRTLGQIKTQAVEMTRQRTAMENTLNEIRRQADLLEGQNAFLRKQLETTERPWIAHRLAIASPLTWDENGLSIIVRWYIKNVGKTPATSLNGYPTTFLGKSTSVAEKNARYVVGVKNHPSNSGETLLPGDDLERCISFSLPKEQIMPTLLGEVLVPLWLFSCVSYRSVPFDSDPYHTSLIYHVQRIRQGGGRLAIAYGENVPAEELILEVETLSHLGYVLN